MYFDQSNLFLAHIGCSDFNTFENFFTDVFILMQIFSYIYGEYPYKIKSNVFKVPSGQKVEKMPVLRR